MEVCVLVPLGMDGDSRIGIVSGCGIVYNWNSFLPTPVVEDAKDSSKSNNKGKEDATNNARR